MKLLPNQTEMPRIIIVDDHIVFRQKLKKYIENENFATVIAEANNGRELTELLIVHKPDILLIDIEMPQMNGLEVIKKALELIPDLKIVVFTLFDDNKYFLKMIEHGVRGFILKICDMIELKKAIQTVMNGEKYFSINKIEHVERLIKKNDEVGIDKYSIRVINSRINIYNAIPWF